MTDLTATLPNPAIQPLSSPHTSGSCPEIDFTVEPPPVVFVQVTRLLHLMVSEYLVEFVHGIDGSGGGVVEPWLRLVSNREVDSQKSPNTIAIL